MKIKIYKIKKEIYNIYWKFNSKFLIMVIFILF